MQVKQEVIDKFLNGVANDLTNEIVEAIGQANLFNTGDLINSIEFIVEDGVIKITANKTLFYIEFGTPPHIIRPKNKKALMFKIDGKTIIVKQVNHPGTRPNPIVRNTVLGKFNNIVVSNAKRHLGGVAA